MHKSAFGSKIAYQCAACYAADHVDILISAGTMSLHSDHTDDHLFSASRIATSAGGKSYGRKAGA